MEKRIVPVERPRVSFEKKEEMGVFSASYLIAKRAYSRVRRLYDDPVTRKGGEALTRTAINAGIVVADVFPGVGDALSWGADAAKVVGRMFNISAIDLTPDVSAHWAVWTEVLEFCSGGLFPTHAIESSMQFKADWPRMKEGFKRAREIWQNDVEAVKKDAQLKQAAAVFGIQLAA